MTMPLEGGAENVPFLLKCQENILSLPDNLLIKLPILLILRPLEDYYSFGHSYNSIIPLKKIKLRKKHLYKQHSYLVKPTDNYRESY